MASLSDNFDAGGEGVALKDAADWAEGGGAWHQYKADAAYAGARGVRVTSANWGVSIYQPTLDGIDQRVELKVKGSSVTNNHQYGVVARVLDPNNMYQCDGGAERAAYNANLRLGKLVGGSWTILAQVNDQPWNDTNWHDMKFEVDGTSLKGFMDGAEEVSTTDSDVDDGTRAGIYSEMIYAYMDNWSAEDIGGVTPQELAGLAEGQSTAEAVLTVAKELVGLSEGQAAASGILTLAKELAGLSEGQATAAGALTLAKRLAGLSEGQATAIGTLTLAKGLAGLAEGQATAAAILTLAKTLAGLSEGQSAATGALTVEGGGGSPFLVNGGLVNGGLVNRGLVA